MQSHTGSRTGAARAETHWHGLAATHEMQNPASGPNCPPQWRVRTIIFQDFVAPG